MPSSNERCSFCQGDALSLLQGYLTHKTPPLLGPYSRTIPRAIGGAFLRRILMAKSSSEAVAAFPVFARRQSRTHLSIYLSIYLSTYPSFFLSIYLYIYIKSETEVGGAFLRRILMAKSSSEAVAALPVFARRQSRTSPNAPRPITWTGRIGR